MRADQQHLNNARHAIRAAEFERARAEFEQISAQFRAEPSALKVEWLIEAAERHWDRCVTIARKMTDLQPEQSPCWIALAKSLLRAGQAEEAYVTLSRATSVFPEDAAVRETLASICLELGKTSEAASWERIATELRQRTQKSEPLARRWG